MRLPVRHVAGNIIWTTHGTCWAVWRVTAANYSHATAAAKRRRLKAIESLIKSLQGEPMLLSLCPQVDPAQVVRDMTAGIDLEASDRYVDLAHTVLDQLETMELTGRTDWLAIPLPSESRRGAITQVLSAARAELAGQLGLMPAPISAAEEQRRTEQAARIQAQWPAAVPMRPATESEILWIYGHSVRRGLAEPLLPAPDDSAHRVRGRGRTTAALSESLLAEGGTDFGSRRGRPTGNPFQRRFLQVSTEWGDSYQALLALSEMPEEFAFPGSEYLQALDQFPFPVDWVARLHITPGHKAEAKSRRRARELAHQEAEYDGDAAGAPDHVRTGIGKLSHFRSRVTSSAREVEVGAMVALCVWGQNADEAQDRATAVASHFGPSDYTFARPLGEQEALFYGMLPGCRTPRVMTAYRQILLASDFAMAMPLAGAELGDDTGALYGLQLASGGVRPVLVDFSRGPRENASASAAFIGELGAGKSVAMKAAVYSVLARGRRTGQPSSRGRAVIVDRTRNQEWLRFASACPGSTQTITVDQDAQISLDPLRLFAPQEAARFTESFLTLLLGVRPMDLEGVALSEATAAVLAGPAPSMRALTEELEARGANDPAAQGLARKLKAVARKDLSRVVFDPTLPVAAADADSVVFSVHALQLPKRAELGSDFRLERMEFEKVMGRALMYLIAALCRQIAVASPEEFAVCVWDECWWLTSSSEGLELLLELVRDGRKHNAAAFVGSHDSDDVGPSDNERGAIVRGLIPHRLLFRQTTSHLARRGLAFLDLDGEDKDLLELVTTGLSPLDLPEAEREARLGECLYRDLLGRVGTMKILIPADPAAAATIHTTPAREPA
ncbi:ATP-binding protein [Streptomyces antimycoticus]